MASEALKGALPAIYPMITCRLKQAHDIAAAAETCAASGNNEGAHRILLEIDQHTHEANTLIEVISLFRREVEV
jgi:hypothetical protein